MKTFLLTFIAFFYTFYLFAEDKRQPVIVFGDKTEMIQVPSGIYYFPDSKNSLTIQQLLSKPIYFRFRECEGSAPTYSGDGIPYWFRFKIANSTQNQQSIIINLPIAFYDAVDFYCTKKDSLTQAPQHLSWRILQENRIFPHRNFIFRCRIAAADTLTCYIRLKKDFGTIWLPMSLWKESFFNYHFYTFDYNSWGFIQGAFCFVAFFAMLIFFALRDRIYAIYAVYVIFMLWFVLTSQGFFIRYYINGFFGIEANKLRFYLSLLMLASNAAFTYDYLHLKEHPNEWLPVSFKAMIYFLFFLMLFMYADHQLLKDYLFRQDTATLTAIFTAFFWIPSVFVFGTLIGCMITDYRRIEAIYYMIANLPLFVLVIYTAFSNYGWLPGTVLVMVDYFAIAFLIEVVILSFALAFRFKMIKEGRENLITERNYLLEKRTETIMQAEEKERMRIARDLHDGVGQLLAAARMSLGNTLGKHNNRKDFQSTFEILEESIRELRAVSHNMMPNVLVKLGLVSALRQLTQNFNTNGKLDVDFQVIGVHERLDNRTETVLYRVVQEIFSNIIKHSEATKVNFQMIEHENELILIIEDNGKGYDTNLMSKSEGIGLKNIITRVEYLNGSVIFDSSPQKGTSVIIEIPLNQSHEKH